MIKKYMKTLPYFFSFMSIVGCYFNIMKDPICWPIWLLSAVGFSWYCIKQKDYGASIIWIFYSFFDLYGWWVWTR